MNKNFMKDLDVDRRINAVNEGKYQAVVAHYKELTRQQLMLHPEYLHTTPESLDLYYKIKEHYEKAKYNIYLVTVPDIATVEAVIKFAKRKCFYKSAYVAETSKDGYHHYHIACQSMYTIGLYTLLKYAKSTFKNVSSNMVDVKHNPMAFSYISKQSPPVYVQDHHLPDEKKFRKNEKKESLYR